MNIVNNQQEDNRLRLRYSNIKLYKECPKMFKLSLSNQGESSESQKKNFAKGNLFEYFVTGQSSDPRDIESIIKKNKGRFDGMLKKTVDGLRDMAEDVKKHILEMSHVQFKISYDKDPRFILDSHIDLIGVLQFNELNNGKPFPAIADIKWTSNIEDVWDTKSSKDDFLQGLIYIWQVYEQTGSILPFVYIVCQKLNDHTIVKPFVINSTPEDFSWIKDNYIEPILNDKTFKANPSEFNCLGRKMVKGKCRFINLCDEGKALMSKPSIVNFNSLNE